MTEENSTFQDMVYGFAAAGASGGKKSGLCFAARASGLYRSEDGGNNWYDAFQSLGLSQAVAATAVALPPDFEHDHTVLAGMAGGILRSGDGGKTWLLAKVPSPPPMVTSLALSPDFSRDGIALAGTMEDGILNTSDHGQSWLSWNFGLLDLSVLCLAISPDFSADETLFAGTDTGIFRSTNGGRAWREVELPTGFEPVLCLAISPSYRTDRTLYAGTETKGVLRSRDGGKTWELLEQSFGLGPVNGLIFGLDDPSGPEIALLTEGQVWLSRDEARTWTRLWQALDELDDAISALHAPEGFGRGKPALLGLYNGGTLRTRFE